MAVPRGSLVAVVGRVGMGKSSLLSAILAEIEKNNGTVNVHGDIAYVPQQAWIQNDTLQNNILFGKPLKRKTYKAITDACALVKDLEILPGKDQTEIGEKGINLSGGQKQRVSMARAVYNNADIYLLDDPLSAVDAHVGKHIFDHVIGNKGFLRNKTRVLVTHGLTWLQEVDKIYVMDNGRIAEVGSYTGLMRQEGKFARFIREYKPDLPLDEDGSDVEDAETATKDYENMIESGYISEDKTEEGSNSEPEQTGHDKHLRRSISRALSQELKAAHEDTEGEDDDEYQPDPRQDKFDRKSKEKGKIVEDEEIEIGKVQMKYLLPYVSALGKASCVFIFLFFLGFKFADFMQCIWVKQWTADDDLRNLSSMPSDSAERSSTNLFYVVTYAALGVFQGIVLVTYDALTAFAITRAATTMHERMLTNVLRGKMAFFDTTPVGRIINRFSHDMDILDGEICDQIEGVLHSVLGIGCIFAVIMYSVPKFIIMVVPVTVILSYMQQYFVSARRQISRLESKKKSPIFSHFSESLGGTSVIRAYGCQARFALESASRVDAFQETQFTNNSVDRWMCIRLDMFNLLCFIVTVCFALLERENISGAEIGLMMTYATRLNWELVPLIRRSGEIERSFVSIERIGQYSSRETEAALHTPTQPREGWPDEGVVELSDYSLRYRPDTDLVLRGINVAVRKGEKVGIVGRTGAGKSSLTIALFRLVEPATGSVHIDGYDVTDVGLFDLRSNLTILPQEPVLFSGTLRTNLDPMNAHSNEAIYNALEHAHLNDFVTSLPDKLEYECGEGGQNLSVGQRQLVCLARSLLRKSKVLVLDEATAAVDLQTDELIQNTIKNEFRDCTVLTIAHRLNTIIDYDRILVLSRGEVVEFDNPKTLLQNKASVFYSMAKDANLVS